MEVKPKIRKNLEGHTFGRLTVLAEYRARNKRTEWRCRCRCGTELWVIGSSLSGGNTKSCGCLNTERVKEENDSRKGPEQLRLEASGFGGAVRRARASYQSMKSRCCSPSNDDYHHYGGRGIEVHQRWLESFDNFLADMGPRPEGMTLERVNNDGNYEPHNCVWATRSEQAQNTRAVKLVTWEGETHTIAEWERRRGFKPGTLKARLGPLGYTVAEAFTKPVKCGVVHPSRHYKPRRKPNMANVPRGFNHPCTKLTPAQVAVMRHKHGNGEASFSSLAREFGVSIDTASKAVQGHGAYKEITC